MKNLLSLILVIIFVLIPLAGCSSTKVAPPVEEVVPPIEEIEISEKTESEEPEPVFMSYEEFFSKERPFFLTSYASFEDSINIEYKLVGKTKEEINVYYYKIYNERLIFEGVINNLERDNYHVYFLQDNSKDSSLVDIVQLDFQGNVKVLFTDDSRNELLELFAYNNVVFYRSGKQVYRYYSPDNVWEAVFIIPYDNSIFVPISTTDISFTDESQRSEYDYGLIPGSINKVGYFYSTLTDKAYMSYIGRETDTWDLFSNFYKNHLDKDFAKEGINNFSQYKEKYIVPRGESIEKLEAYSLLIYTRHSQYLKKRGEDLVAMGIDPHDVSTFRYPEDDAFFFDPTGNYWGATD